MSEPRSSLTESIELLQRGQNGEDEALNRLIARYYPRVRLIVRARLGRLLRTRVDSVDILQETFLLAVQKIDGFEPRSNADIIRRLARFAENQIRKAVQEMRAAKRDPARERRFEQASSVEGWEPAGETPRPEELAASNEEDERVARSLELLPEDYREVILLRNHAGSAWEEVAEEMGKPSPAAARMLYSRAMAELASVFRRSP